MMAMAAAGLMLFSLFFGFVGLFVGADFFILPAALGLAIGLALITREALRLRWIRQLQDRGVVVQARTERREQASVRIMGMTPVRIVCTALARRDSAERPTAATGTLVPPRALRNCPQA